MICKANIYASFGLLMCLSLGLQAASMYFTKVTAVQFLLVQMAFFIAYIASLPLGFNAFNSLCEAAP